MFAYLFALAEVVQNAVANNPGAVAAAAAAVAITGSALVALMRKHKIKNKELADAKEVTQARRSGINDPDKAARWQNASHHWHSPHGDPGWLPGGSNQRPNPGAGQGRHALRPPGLPGRACT